ncbi:TIGR02217 family protein [Rhodobacteraceae bacterium RKSG542]|uniref:DUF2460 domain-containing protein n=1 Tax=Pseudovibrio flavus TaxID=2529854 RepID=UPI0012BD1715|nr:DUF2460 domain-containing protein [Pseudovibrio flavus]MTI17054.1 TIGR02217 family protein [Pseudovibrio flavus]
MSTFVEKRFPVSIGFGASGGPVRRTRIFTFANGREVRSSSWAASRRRYDAGTGIRSLKDLQQVLAFFEKTQGPLKGFRFRDPFDHSTAGASGIISATDVVIASGDGSTSSFQLVKRYGTHPDESVRTIRKPVGASVKLAINNSQKTVGTDYTLNAETGEVQFLSAPPAAGTVISAGFEFDTPVRFESDQLEASLTHFEAGQLPSIPLIEISST